ncbi:MAG: type I methionyl aminopeptidase [Alphaproteobacteria bacterium]|nr:type I methionyl aminopeptidase [Alphaproteobacteria bacterium]
MTNEDSEEGLIEIHGEEDFAAMRAAGRLAADLLDYITPFVVPGARTGDLDDMCDAFTRERGAVSAPLGYRGYPRATCMSINHVVCHGIPGDKVLEEGDIVNIDVTPKLNGWHGDSSRMFFVGGKTSLKARRLVEITYECLMLGIQQVRPGATLGDIGHVIQQHAEAARFSVVRDFCGHGTGQTFHTQPSVLHYGHKGEGAVLKKGMIFTIEPMINAGKYDIKVLSDGWTAVTKDKSLSAQFEHTIGVTETGCEIFTKSAKGFDCPPYIAGAEG